MQTQNVVAQFQEIQLTLNKSKETYHNLCIEFDKAKRQLDANQLASFQQLSQQQISASNLMSLANISNNTTGQGNQGGSALMVLSSNGGAGGNQNATAINQNMSAGGQQLSNSVNQAGISGGSGNAMVQLTTGGQQTSGGAADRLSSLATSITANRVTQLLKLEKKVVIESL